MKRAINPKGDSGYTLIEIIVTLGLLSVIMFGVVGVGSAMHHHIEERKYRAECNQLLDLIFDCRNRAMMSSREAWITFHGDRVMVTTYHLPADRNESQRTVFEVLRLKGDYYNKRLIFNERGNIASRGGDLDLFLRETYRDRLVIQLYSGRIYIEGR
jgi:prepilin-type N-terminal cleavage/methylation domain-containing protein